MAIPSVSRLPPRMAACCTSALRRTFRPQGTALLIVPAQTRPPEPHYSALSFEFDTLALGMDLGSLCFSGVWQLEAQFCRCGPIFLINLFRKSWFSGSGPSGPYLVVHLFACKAIQENRELSLWTHLFHDTDHDTNLYFTDLRDLQTELNDLLRISSMIS